MLVICPTCQDRAGPPPRFKNAACLMIWHPRVGQDLNAGRRCRSNHRSCRPIHSPRPTAGAGL